MKMINRKLIVAITLLLLLLISIPLNVRSKLGHDMRIIVGQEHLLPLQLPLNLYIKTDRPGIIEINGHSPLRGGEYTRLSQRNNLALIGLNIGSVSLEFSLFNGLIPLRQLTVNVLPEKEVMPGGHSIGIKLHKKGVIVAGYFYLKRDGALFSPAEEAGIKPGDIILSLNDHVLNDIEKAASTIKMKAAQGPLIFKVMRDKDILNLSVVPYFCLEAQEYRIGLYIRDTAAGVGTLTFYDPLSRYYGALGHIITDPESNNPVEITDGVIVQADVVNIKIAQRGQPGEKAGIFREGGKILGTIERNTSSGIYGQLKHMVFYDYNTPYNQPLPVALAFQVEEGPAEMLTVVEGNRIQSFMVYIERTVNQNKPGDKGMVIRVVDEQLLEITGGIVQGMSGSPILQNGRIVGAVTHVFLNDPARGYAIYAEWMFRETGIYPYT